MRTLPQCYAVSIEDTAQPHAISLETSLRLPRACEVQPSGLWLGSYAVFIEDTARKKERQMKEVINTKSAPQAVGPYSQAIKTGNFVFISGQIPLDPETGLIKGNNVKEQTELVLKNLKAIVEASGSSVDKIVKTTCFLKNINDFPEFNKVYELFFKDNALQEVSFPARSTLGGLQIPKGALVEVEAIAEV